MGTLLSSAYAADNNGDYIGLTVAALVANGFVQSPNVTTVVVEATPNHAVIESRHSYGGRTYRYDSATGKVEPVIG